MPVSATAIAAQATIINVLSADSDSSGTIVPASVTIVSSPTDGGTATANADGTITYTAASGFAGVESFFYNVKDNTGFTSAATLVTVTVSNPAKAPIASSTATTGLANGSLAINVTGNVNSTVGLDLSTLAVAAAPCARHNLYQHQHRCHHLYAGG